MSGTLAIPCNSVGDHDQPGKDWNELFRAELVPVVGNSSNDVLVWAISGAVTTATITDQFTSGARRYHDRYAASDHFAHLFAQAIAATGIAIAPRPTILDLGSGSGANSVVPCRRLFPGARIVATDLSAELLAMLAGDLSQGQALGEILCVQMDAMSEHVAPAAFDLVTGASILHHLDSPEDGIAAAGRALKPGAHAIFFEPFHGWAIMRLAFERVLVESRLRGEPLDSEVEAPLRQLIDDVRLRSILNDRRGPAFERMDDKWLFSSTRIKAAGLAAGFSQVRLVPHNDHATLYRDSAAVHLRLATGRSDLALPPWAVEILDAFDSAMTLHAKRELMLEGAIVMTKAE